MSWISAQFARHWRYIHFGSVVALCLILIFGPAVVTTAVGQVTLSGLYLPFFKIRSGFELMRSQAVANAELRQSLMEASLKLSAYEESVRENERLRSALGFEPPPGYRLTPAEVVSVSGYQEPVTAVINRGGSDSIVVNQTVINQDGLIGRVSAVTAGYATVQLLTDPANRVAARVASSREMGIVKFQLMRGMILDNFPTHGTIAVGDTIVSSGLGGVYPAGLKVGIVTSVERHEDEAFCAVTLQPLAEFRSIEELFVLRSEDRR